MRWLFLAVSFSFALTSWPLTSAAQHAVVAPAALPPVVHAVPMHAATVGIAHSGAVHSSVRPSARPGMHTGTASLKTSVKSAGGRAPAPKTAWHSNASVGTNSGSGPLPQPGPYLPTYPPLVPNAPVLLPGNIFSGQSCFAPYNCFPIPGLGFSYSHFFATHPGWGSPILTAGVVVPFGGGGGFYLPIPYYSAPPVQEQEEAPANNDNGNGGSSEQGDNNHNQQQVAPQQQSAPAAAQGYYPPSEPMYEYVFVKRDGTKIFAVAYSLTKDKLQYVTKEGLRRSLSLDTLDFDATRKSNEERGNTITLPSAPPSAMAMAS